MPGMWQSILQGIVTKGFSSHLQIRSEKLKSKGIILIIILLAAVAVLVFGVKSRKVQAPTGTVVGLDAPELVVQDLSGKKYTLSELKGSVVFINFWATWCDSCKEEMPSIQKLYNSFRDEKGMRVITVLYRDDYKNVDAYMKQNNYGFPVLMDSEDRSARAYGLTGVPETYIVDKKGILREKVIGPADWSSPQAMSLIANLIKE